MSIRFELDGEPYEGHPDDLHYLGHLVNVAYDHNLDTDEWIETYQYMRDTE